MYGLEENTISKIKNIFSKYPQIEKVILYGSRAKGNFHNGSDIDITLQGKNLTLSNSVYPVSDELDELYLPYMFDISILKHIKDTNLIEHIDRVGKVFYASTNLQ
ncbi:MAG: nucleotidyltransferase domain-containing protein [Spirochaetia bacterium]|jgi:predicted nucleotidyltransferase|nr:nucleotidyltransferase domain-containing protein [Spirochaetia bacterium]